MTTIKITTSYNSDLIQQEIAHCATEHFTDAITSRTLQIIRLSDEGVRKALINLGWKPPLPDPPKDGE